ncbi:hypothetical protein CLV47_104224 [Antricoccus suffuscus]|uniref:NnrS family protein n=1 Tax=Antricoccus suffuscus TaxID=1629062 RepID=A0A2T1A2R0_9ACTN|nr:hypothetical protein [Antricoccus suffuscus]PRZ42876.1 hypothetical protein CLV47_104224 [Antricoccus suffuscus]
MAGVTAPTVSLTNARGRRRGWVAPIMIGAVVILIAALWSGLVHLGLPLPTGGTSLNTGHGPMMVLGFLGTLISLERAVALGAPWAYVAPVAAGLGGLGVLFGAPDGVPAMLVTLGGLILVGVFVAVHRIQASMHNVVLASGAICWVVAGCLWLAGWEVYRFLPWMVGFLVLTISGERLELSRLTGAAVGSRWLFSIAAGIFGGGLVVSSFIEVLGVRVAGVGLIALALWLARFDIARRTVRTNGLTRFMAAALLTGYAWLATGGILWLTLGHMTRATSHQPAYDAMLHAILLGFVISMIFAHAPVIVPSVLGRPFPYHRWLYLPLALLHLSLLLRLVGGDWLQNQIAWQWGGVFNEVALLLYMGMAVYGLFLSHLLRPDPRRAKRPQPSTASGSGS